MKPSIADVDRHFREVAQNAFDRLGLSALEFLYRHPAVSLLELAKRLNRGASAIGLSMVIYQEAERAGRTREIAVELLYREILAEFPDGWYTDPRVHAGAKLLMWHSAAADYTATSAPYSLAVLRDLTMENAPSEGWKPTSVSDERLQHAFDRCWPPAA